MHPLLPRLSARQIEAASALMRAHNCRAIGTGHLRHVCPDIMRAGASLRSARIFFCRGERARGSFRLRLFNFLEWASFLLLLQW